MSLFKKSPKGYDTKAAIDTVEAYVYSELSPSDFANSVAPFLSEIREYVLPVFDVLCDRQAILAKRREYPCHDVLNHRLIMLDECFIYGRMGDTEKARMCFTEYYNNSVFEYEKLKRNGSRIYLKKGGTVIYKDQKIVAEKDGYYKVFNANDGHIKYLEELEEALGFSLN